MKMASHPARGAWIEISCARPKRGAETGRTPQGVRGLKCGCPCDDVSLIRRTPQGVRGLKYVTAVVIDVLKWSHPARGAWIEIGDHVRAAHRLRSHPARGAWIEIAQAL